MQFAKAGNRFITAGRQAVIRLMTPLGTRYEDAYSKAFPFDRLIEEIIQPGMIAQTARLMWDALSNNVEINIIINNRAAGNAPLLAQRIVGEFVELGRRGKEAEP
jgi:phosphoheptose isomerase